MITPQEILELSEPAEAIYQHIVDELLANIARHLRSNETTWTAYWEIQKLAEMGQLTAENAAIINRWIAEMPDVLKETMEETRKAALAQIEEQLKAAVESGHLTEPINDSTVGRLRDFLEQAADKFNGTNTTMLESSLEMYQDAVQEAAERIMAEGAADLVEGAKTRDQVLRDTIRRLAEEGLTGFTDRAGRDWSPEAYVNMVMRTTVHNSAIAATRARMEDYGTDVFQVSSHAGAREGCYPFQGKYYSWGGGSGEIELGNGKVVSYAPISSTTYGEPAGLFGINCGHSPIPVIPGVTIPHGADNIQPEAANKKEYAESQRQRQLEREIRENKRLLEMLGSLATDADKAALRDKQREMREFIGETGRARRPDREKVYPSAPVRRRSATEKTVIGSDELLKYLD